jgi:hypothetical protein
MDENKKSIRDIHEEAERRAYDALENADFASEEYVRALNAVRLLNEISKDEKRAEIDQATRIKVAEIEAESKEQAAHIDADSRFDAAEVENDNKRKEALITAVVSGVGIAANIGTTVFLARAFQKEAHFTREFEMTNVETSRVAPMVRNGFTSLFRKIK